MSKISKKELVTFLFSGIALIGSITSLYFQFFYTNNKLIYNARFVDIKIFENKIDATLSISFVNIGNQTQYLELTQLACTSKEKNINIDNKYLKREFVTSNEKPFTSIGYKNYFVGSHVFEHNIISIKPKEKLVKNFTINDFNLDHIPRLNAAWVDKLDEYQIISVLSYCEFFLSLSFLNSKGKVTSFYSKFDNKDERNSLAKTKVEHYSFITRFTVVGNKEPQIIEID